MNTAEHEVMIKLFEHYEEIILRYSDDKSECSENKCDNRSLQRLCWEVIDNGQQYPYDKVNRWLGFVQGVLAARGVIDVDIERYFTRPLLHSLYSEVPPSFDSAKSN